MHDNIIPRTQQIKLRHENRRIVAVNLLRSANNYLDDDQVQAAIDQILEAKTIEELREGMLYAISCLLYRGKTQTAGVIKNYLKEIEAK